MEVPLGFFLTDSWLTITTTHPDHPPAPISTTSNIMTVAVKASQNKAGQTISDDYASLLEAYSADLRQSTGTVILT